MFVVERSEQETLSVLLDQMGAGDQCINMPSIKPQRCPQIFDGFLS